MKLPFLRALRAAYPQARITWLAGRGETVFATILAPLVAGLIDEVISNGHVTGQEWLPTRAAPLPGRSFDLIIDTQRHARTTLALRRIKHRAFISGAAGWWLSSRAPKSGKQKRPAMIHQMLALIEAATGKPPIFEVVPLAIDAGTAGEARRLLPDRADGRAFIGIAPGAAMEEKLWPIECFIALAQRLSRAGHVPVFLLGPLERRWVETIKAKMPDALMPLPEDAPPLLTVALGRRLAMAVANDSGQGHLLAAAATPLVSLFGPTQAAKFPPMTPKLTIIRAQDFGGDAMTAIPVDAVERTVMEMMRGIRRP
jgi:ADP-heptose:LPS heptosyltransferase